MPMPTRSASASLARVKLIWLWAARPCAAVTLPSTASLGRPVVAPIRIAASIAAAEARFARPAFCSERAMWRCVTCAISCASTPASSASLRVAVTRPALTPMKPPGQREGVDARVAHGEEREAVRALVGLARQAHAERLQVLVDFRVLDDLAGLAQLAHDHEADLVLVGERQRRAGGRADVRQLAARGLRAGRGQAGGELQDEDGRQRAHRALPGGSPGSTAARAHGSPARLRALRRRNRRAASARRAPA